MAYPFATLRSLTCATHQTHRMRGTPPVALCSGANGSETQTRSDSYRLKAEHRRVWRSASESESISQLQPMLTSLSLGSLAHYTTAKCY